MRTCAIALSAAVLLLSLPVAALAHCEIPCGIYDDEMRLNMLTEHVTTIEKSVTEIQRLSAAENSALNANQLARWVMNKERHADALREVVVQYFLTQRIKTPDESDQAAWNTYTQQLVAAHKVLRAAMVCKQTADLAKVSALSDLVQAFSRGYREAQAH